MLENRRIAVPKCRGVVFLWSPFQPLVPSTKKHSHDVRNSTHLVPNDCMLLGCVYVCLTHLQG